MTEQEQVQVTLALRERHEAAESLASAICGCATQEQRKGDIRAVLAFAQEVRHTATAEALEAMREAREALEVVWNNVSLDNVCVPMVSKAHARLTAAIAKIEGEQP